jgi:bile acid:Na+ symporter, BASS family
MMIDRLLEVAYGASLVATLWATGLGLGMSLAPGDFAPILSRVGLFGRAFFLDCVVLPLLAWSLVESLSVREDFAIGLLLVAIASAGPLGIKASEVARADVPLAILLVVVLEAANVVVIPGWVALWLSVGSVPITPVVTTLVFLILCPLAVGLALRLFLRERVAPWISRLRSASNIGLVFVIMLVLLRYLPRIPDAFHGGAGLVSVVMVVAALGAGWVIGGPERSTRASTSLVTGIRANGPALAIAQVSYPGRPNVAVAIVTFGLFSVLLPLLAALFLRRRLYIGSKSTESNWSRSA